MFTHIKRDSHKFPTLLQEIIDNVRYYKTEEGLLYPSVTTVLAEHNRVGIEAWVKRVGVKESERIKSKSAIRGIKVHQAIELYLNNYTIEGVKLFPHEKILFVQMKSELNKINNIHCLEVPLCSHTLELAGKVDCIAEYNGELCVIDFKTSLKPKKEKYMGGYRMQLAAYAHMFTEMTGIPINKTINIIGVDNYQQPQVFVSNPLEHMSALREYIAKYYI